MQFDSATDTPPDPRIPTAVRWLIGANVALYFLQLTVLNAADARAQLGFELHDLDGAWWTIGTYMFVHGGFWHLALNMFTLWMFGPRVEREWGAGQFTGFFILCGLGGWFFHLLFVREGLLIGASAAVMGVMLAYGSRWPNEQFLLFGLIPTTVRWLVAILVVVNVVAGIRALPDTGIAYMAHLGGLVTGWAYVRMAGTMNIDRLRQRVAPIADEPEDMPPRAVPRSVPRPRGDRDARDVDEIVAQSRAAIVERATRTPPRQGTMSMPPDYSPAELNELLDKISAHGLDALTNAERKQLEDAARKLQPPTPGT